jgi:hypothetical protein
VTLSRSELSALLGEVERRAPVHEWMVDGLHVWPLLRLTLYSETQDVVVPGASLGTALGNVRAGTRSLIAWTLASVRDFGRSRAAWSRCDVLFLASSVGSQLRVDGRRVNPLVAPYAELFKREGLVAGVWELAPFAEYNLPRQSPSAFIQPIVHYDRLRSLLPWRGEARVNLPGIERLFAPIRELGLVYRYSVEGALERDVRYLQRLVKRFTRWMSRSKPTIGAVSNYGIEDQAFCLAARRLGFPTVAIQHGVQGELHPAFGRWSRVPPDGFDSMPTHYWSWDEPSAAAINEWTVLAGLGPRAVVGGNAWTDAVRNGTSEGFAKFDRTFRELRQVGKPASRHVLVSLDSMEYVLPERLQRVLEQAPKDWCFWLRLHPVNQARQRRGLEGVLHGRDWNARTDAEITEAPLPLVLQHVDAHLSATWSSVVKDAEKEGVASVACAFRAQEFFPEAIESGMLLVAEEPDRIIESLRRQIERPRAPRMEVVGAGAHAARVLASASPDQPVERVLPVASA